MLIVSLFSNLYLTICQPNYYTYIGSADDEAINTLPTDTTVKNSYGSVNGAEASISQLYKRLLVYYSPETELLPKLEANTFTKIRRVGQFTFVNDNDGVPGVNGDFGNKIKWQHSEYEKEDTGILRSALRVFSDQFFHTVPCGIRCI